MKFSSAEITQIIVAIIALAGVVFQAIITYIIATKKQDDRPELKREKPTIIDKLGIEYKKNPKKFKKVNLLILIVLLIAAIPGVNIYRGYLYEPYITINDPKNEQMVHDTIDVKGTYRNIDGKQQALWVAVYSYTDHRYFLQDRPADLITESKEWVSRETLVGINMNVRESYDIIVMLIDNKSGAHDLIDNYLKRPNKEGLQALPVGAQIMQQVRVYNKNP